jgi:hypothetical protein
MRIQLLRRTHQLCPADVGERPEQFACIGLFLID